MSLILNIDTASETAHVSIARDGQLQHVLENHEQKNHASFLEPAIKQLADKSNIKLSELDAIAVTEGPGSYTGLRIGMASAKGLCYALNKPLITISSLEAMTLTATSAVHEQITNPSTLFCPMIDARRAEVFTALYDISLKNILPPCAIILTENSFENFFNDCSITFFGSGSEKWKLICSKKNAFFQQIGQTFASFASLSYQKFKKSDFNNIAYSEPSYIKDFYIK